MPASGIPGFPLAESVPRCLGVHLVERAPAVARAFGVDHALGLADRPVEMETREDHPEARKGLGTGSTREAGAELTRTSRPGKCRGRPTRIPEHALGPALAIRDQRSRKAFNRSAAWPMAVIPSR